MWLAARDVFGTAAALIAASAAGYGLGLLAGAALVGYETDLGSLAAMGAISGAVLGTAQGLTLAAQGRRPLAIAWSARLDQVLETESGGVLGASDPETSRQELRLAGPGIRPALRPLLAGMAA